MNDTFLLGGALFTSALNYIVARDLLRNKEWYADHIQMKNGKHHSFQASKKLSDLRQLLLAKAEHVTPQAATASKRSFTEMLQELDDDNDAGPSTSTRRSNKAKEPQKQKKVRHVISESSDESDAPEAAPKLPHLEEP